MSRVFLRFFFFSFPLESLLKLTISKAIRRGNAQIIRRPRPPWKARWKITQLRASNTPPALNIFINLFYYFFSLFFGRHSEVSKRRQTYATRHLARHLARQPSVAPRVAFKTTPNRSNLLTFRSVFYEK